MTAALSLESQTFLGLNQEAYQQLRLSVSLNLRRQLLIAVCDDILLQHQLAARLEADLRWATGGSCGQASPTATANIVTLKLDQHNPDLVRQVLIWLKQHQPLAPTERVIPAFQILGIEQLTRQSPTLQNRFLASLIRVDTLFNRLDCRLLIWVPRPWLSKIRQSVPGFWRSRNGLFEFAGDPTPLDQIPQLAASGQITLETTSPAPDVVISPSSAVESESLSSVSPSSPMIAEGQPSSQLWTMLEEDLTDLEQGPAAAIDHQPQSRVPKSADPPSRETRSTPTPTKREILVADETLITRVISPLNSDPAASDQALIRSAPPLRRVAPDQPFRSGQPLEHQPPDTRVLESPVSSPAVTATELTVSSISAPNPDAPDSDPLSVAGSSPVPPLPAELAQDSAITSLWQQVQTLIAQQAGPLTLGSVYLALGQQVRDRIEAGDTSSELLEFAIASLQAAIPSLITGSPDWGDTLNDLGSLYWLRSQHDSDPTAITLWLNHSIHTYQTALTAAQSASSADSLVRLCTNLGTVYSLLANLQDPVEPLEQAVRAYHQALNYGSAQSMPAEYANIQNSLGAIHWRLAQMGNDPRRHLHDAITAYIEALPHRPAHQMPLEFAMIQNNLGIAYWSLAQHERPSLLLQQAIQAYQAALAYRTLATDPVGCASTQNNLGTAYWDLAQQHLSDLTTYRNWLHQAATAYEAALMAADRATQQDPTTILGFDIWATFHSAGVVHDQLAQQGTIDDLPSRIHHLDQALQYYLLAYQGWQGDADQTQLLVAALAQNVRLQFDYLGSTGQQTALSQIPGELLPDILPHL